MITMPDPDQINAAMRSAEALTAYRRACAVAIDPLFDPTTNPKMWARGNAIMRHLRTSHDLHYVDHAPEGMKPFDPHDPGQQAALVHYVGEANTVHVARDGRTLQGWSWLHRTRWPVDEPCDITEAADCRSREGWTAYVTVTRPPYVLVFSTCYPCFLHINDVAVSGQILGEVDAEIAFDARAAEAVQRWRSIHDYQAGAR